MLFHPAIREVRDQFSGFWKDQSVGGAGVGWGVLQRLVSWGCKRFGEGHFHVLSIGYTRVLIIIGMSNYVNVGV